MIDSWNKDESILRERIADLERQLEKAKSDIQCMVDKAATNHLEGYREMGRNLAEKDAEIERLRDALTRLASPEAFYMSRATNTEDRMRMKYAEKALEQTE